MSSLSSPGLFITLQAWLGPKPEAAVALFVSRLIVLMAYYAFIIIINPYSKEGVEEMGAAWYALHAY